MSDPAGVGAPGGKESDMSVDGPASGQPGGALRPIVVGITGATGSIIGIRLLEALRALQVETLLVLSEWAERTIRVETEYSVAEVRDLAVTYYQNGNMAAPISSGSFPAGGMVIAPCSMNTLAAVAHGITGKLIARAADVTLKEGRKLVLVPRETPLHSVHLRNMLTLSEMGAGIVPPMPAFYNHPETVDDIVRHIVARVLDQLQIDNELTVRWGVTRRLHPDPMRPRPAPARAP